MILNGAVIRTVLLGKWSKIEDGCSPSDNVVIDPIDQCHSGHSSQIFHLCNVWCLMLFPFNATDRQIRWLHWSISVWGKNISFYIADGSNERKCTRRRSNSIKPWMWALINKWELFSDIIMTCVITIFHSYKFTDFSILWSSRATPQMLKVNYKLKSLFDSVGMTQVPNLRARISNPRGNRMGYSRAPISYREVNVLVIQGWPNCPRVRKK